MRIGLVVDHPKRDLDGIILVAHELVKRGDEVLIIPMYYQGVDVPSLGLDAILVNYARVTNRAFIQHIAAAGIKVFVLDTEGGVFVETGASSPESLARRVRDEFGDALSGYFLWGPRVHAAFEQERAMPSERLHVTGCPRFDYTAPRWRPILDQPRRGYLLVNANFPAVNPRFSGSASHERATMVGAGWDAEYADRLFAEMHQLFIDYVRAVRDIVVSRPDLDFLVRPHPFENPEPYLQAFSGLGNVEVNASGNVLHAIHNSRAILHLNCGTAIEAVMLGKLPIQMEFLNTPAWGAHARLPGEVSQRAESREALLSMLDRIDDATCSFPFGDFYDQRIAPFFHLHDGDSAKRVASLIVRDGRPGANARHWRSTLGVIKGSRRDPSIAQIAHGLVSVLLGSSAAATLRAWGNPKRRDKRFSVERVEEMLARLAALDGESAGAGRARRAHGGLLQLPLETVRVSRNA